LGFLPRNYLLKTVYKPENSIIMTAITWKLGRFFPHCTWCTAI
jgi:hypothetical protein